MKKLFAFVLVLLLALPAYAGAEETPAAAETVLAQGDGYTLAYDATEFSFYLDGVTEGSDLLVPTQDAPSPVYMLVSRMEELGLKKEDYWWYLDLRRYGSCRHAGFGLGFERCVMYLTGMGNIRDVIPFPRTVKNCEL